MAAFFPPQPSPPRRYFRADALPCCLLLSPHRCRCHHHLLHASATAVAEGVMEKDVPDSRAKRTFLFLSLAEVKTKVNDAFRTVHSCPLPAYVLAGAWKPSAVSASLPKSSHLQLHPHWLSQASQPLLWSQSEARLCQLPLLPLGVASAGKPPRLMASAQWGLGEGAWNIKGEREVDSWTLEALESWRPLAAEVGHTGLRDTLGLELTFAAIPLESNPHTGQWLPGCMRSPIVL